MQVIYILWLREIKRYIRSRARIIGSLGQPLLFLVALGFGLSPIFKKAGEGDYLQFLAPGIIAMSILFSAIFSGIQVLWDRKFGFLKIILVAPVSRLSIVLGKTIGGASIATFQGIIVLILSCILGFHPQIAYLPISLCVMFLIALVFTSLGIAIASVIEDLQGFQVIMNFLVQPLFFLSGALFPLKELPSFLFFITTLDPLSYGVDALQGTLGEQSIHSVSIDICILLFFFSSFLLLSAYLFNRIQI